MPPDGLDRDDVTHALDALASEVPAPVADARSLIARGRRRILRRRLAVVGVALAVIATVASVSALTNNDDTRRVVAPVPTTAPNATGKAPAGIAVASSLEAWKCLNPLQYTDNGGLTWESIALPNEVPREVSCTAVAGRYAWVTWQDSKNQLHLLRVRGAKAPETLSLPQLPDQTSLGPVTFIDRDHGWFQSYVHESGTPVDLYRTVDGGATWKLAKRNVAGGPIAFADADRGWLSDGPNLSQTDDGGLTWRSVDLPEPAAHTIHIPVFQIRAHDNWVVVWRGVLISGARYHPFFDVSNDGGRTWSLHAGPPDFELPDAGNNAFDAIDGRKWALTSGNSLRITNDAEQWQIRPDVPDVSDVARIYFPTGDVGWATSEGGTIFRTTDSGYSWADVTNGAAPASTTTTTQPPVITPAPPIQMAFVSPTEGWLCSDPLRYTSDAGKSWRSVGYSTQPISPPSYQQALCAAVAGGDAWVLTATDDPRRPEVFHFRRGGLSREGPLAFPRLPDATHIVELDFADSNHGWATSAPSQGGQDGVDLYATSDAGRTWSIVGHHPPNAMHFTNATDGWGAGARHTTDGGATWSTADAPTPDLARGYLVGLGDTVVTPDAIVVSGSMSAGSVASLFFDVSIDGGRTWTMHSGRPPHEIVGTTEPQAFDAVDADHWQLAVSNALYTTADRGDTWKQVAVFAGVENISSVAFLTPKVGFVSATGSPPNHFATAVLATRDGGNSWTDVDQQAPAEPPGGLAPFPGGIIGCPTRPLTPGQPTFEIAQAAAAYAHLSRSYVRNVYSGSSTEGEFASVFRFNVGSCGPHILDDIYVAYVIGPPNAGPGGSTRRVTLALAHYADGWHVFGRYH
jgi:photosystem II stability/assembly factor-like uncharacterized protein